MHCQKRTPLVSAFLLPNKLQAPVRPLRYRGAVNFAIAPEQSAQVEGQPL